MCAFRPYQEDMDNRRKNSKAKSRCNQLPTGGGKSRLIQAAAYETPSAAIIAHREYLIDQLHELVPDAQVIKAGQKWDRKSKRIIGMVQTLCRRDPEDLPDVSRIITDEDHHSAANSYRKIHAFWPDAEQDGYTATPVRADGEGLDDIRDELICGPQYRELIDQGYLKPFELYSIPSGIDQRTLKIIAGDYSRASQNDAIRKSTVFGDVVDYWKMYGRDGAHISFWPSIESAEHAAEGLPGWEVIHSKLPKDVVRQRIKDLEAGNILSLANVDLVGEGLDIRGICSVSRCRSTMSLGLYLQQCGRANRGGEGVARIISHVTDWRDNNHGFPDDDRQWKLQGIQKKKGEAGTVSVWDCPECFAVCRSQQPSCWQCGADKPREIVIVEQREAHLELIEKANFQDIHDLCEEPDQYLAFAKAKGKRPCWAAYQFAMRGIRIDTQENPFLEAGGQPRPTREQFMKSAFMLGLNPKYAAFASKRMHLTK